MCRYIMLCLSIAFLSHNNADAYLDGGTGSMLVQLALGGFVGFFAIIKLYWFKIKSIFSKKDITQSSESEEETQEMARSSVEISRKDI